MLREAFTLIPKLNQSLHKGSCGRICVLGGSEDFAGAPFLAGMSALRAGVDLVYVVCPPIAALSIKAFSPDLVVRPILEQTQVDEVLNTVSKCHAIVCGPGIGTASAATSLLNDILPKLVSLGIPLILDACALTHIAQFIPKDGLGSHVVLTPNIREAKRLVGEEIDNPSVAAVKIIERFGCTVLVKGEADILGSPNFPLVHFNHRVGSYRRVAGQGDVLAGLVSAFCAWNHLQSSKRCPVVPLFGACNVMKFVAGVAFSTIGPGFIASDLLPMISKYRDAAFEDGMSPKSVL